MSDIVSDSEDWYIVKQSDGHCEIIPASGLAAAPAGAGSGDRSNSDQDEPDQQWGPFGSQGEAIARRIGLIRARKCQPV